MRLRIITLCAVSVVMTAPLTSSAQATTHTRTEFDVVNLVSDVSGKAAATDPKLINPWGLAMGETLWVSNAGTGSATVYSGEGRKQQTEVWIPGGAPTGQVVNPGDGFTVKGKPAKFLFASPSGAITGWNAEVDPKNAIIGAFTRGADYKGLAFAETDDGDFLLAPDFASGRVHAFDEDFKRVRLSRSAFRDRTVPRTYSPFNVEVIDDSVYVAYALRDRETGKSVAGNGKGFVSRFDLEGRLTGRINRVGLNAPWAIVKAPRGLGQYAGSLLVGNFGDGTIQAYRNNRHLGALRDGNGRKIALPGLWDLEPGTASNGGENSLWFSAGVDGGKHGLLGVIRPEGSRGSTPSTSRPTHKPSHRPTQSNQSPYGGY